MDIKNKEHKYGKSSTEHAKREKHGKNESGQHNQLPKSEKWGKSGSESRSESRGLEYDHSYEEKE